MSYSCFIDKKSCPSEIDIHAALGPMLPDFLGLIDYINHTYAPQVDGWRYLYGKQYGWALRFMIKKKLLINLYPNQGFFYAQVNLPETAVQEALTWELASSARQTIQNAPQFSEGRWLWFPVRGAVDLRDVQALLDLRTKTRW